MADGKRITPRHRAATGGDAGVRPGTRPSVRWTRATPGPVRRRRRRALDALYALPLAAVPVGAADLWAAEPFCPGGSAPSPAVIWCDGFEDADLGPGGTIGEKYFEFDSSGGDFARVTTQSREGSHSLRGLWHTGQVSAGSLQVHFGRNPLGSQARAGEDFDDVYWRVYLKLADGFQGHPAKLNRLTIFADTNWAQAMIAHIWADESQPQYYIMDPASGVDASGQLVTTGWNDFDHLSWLGVKRGTTAIEPGRWYCVEGHVTLNTPGNADGVFEFWIDDHLEARRADLNWIKTWSGYGLNAIHMSNYWNDGSPTTQERYLDAFVVSTARIGCLGSSVDTIPPDPPTGVTVELARAQGATTQ